MIQRSTGLLALVLTAACGGISPISNRIELGEDPFVVMVGEGVDRRTDLFVGQPGGGRALQLTFTPVIEAAPRVTPDGSLVAFLRMRDTLPDTQRDIVVMSLVTGSERMFTLPPEAGKPVQLAWGDDAHTLYVSTISGAWEIPIGTPGAPSPVAPSSSASADSALAAWVGRPRFARLITCASEGICVASPTGDTTMLTTTGRDPFAWGRDSLAWFEGDALIVRSLGPGTPRRVTWTRGPTTPRDASYAGP